MPGSQFSVERPTIVTATAHVQEVYDQVNGLMKNLIGRLEPVLVASPSWTGDGQVSFANVHQRWDAATRKINEALADIGRQLQLSERTYGDSDTQASSTVTGSVSGMA